MLDFILSKMNLLILVTAIFAIDAFFAASLSDIAKVREAGELASKIKEQSFSLVNSPNYCFTDSYPLPDELSVAGGSYYYVLKISKQELRTGIGNETINMLIFSVFPREEIKKKFQDDSYVPKAIAADSFRTKAELHIYSQDYDGTAYSGNTYRGGGEAEIYIDPQAEIPKNSMELIKEVVGGVTNFYVIACNRDSASCGVEKTTVGKAVQPERGELGFIC